jgi:hypothetical protein
MTTAAIEASSASAAGQLTRSGANGSGLIVVPGDSLPPGPFDSKTLSKDTTSPKTTHSPAAQGTTTIKSDSDAVKKLTLTKKKVKVTKKPVSEAGLRDDHGRYDSNLTSMADSTKSVGTFLDSKGNKKFALYEFKNGKKVRVGTAGDDAALRAHLGLKESDRIALREKLKFHPQFIEGTYNAKARTADVIIITEGAGNSRDSHFYGADTIQDAAANNIFNGSQCYADHPGQDEETNRPERSIKDLLGYFSNCRVVITANGKTSLAATLNIQEGAEWVIGLIKTAIEYGKKFPGKVYAGISINADGDVEPRDMGGQHVNYVHKITGAFSADIVTKPARGGKFLSLVESANGARYQKESYMAKSTLAESAARIQAQIAEGSIDQEDLVAFLKEAAAVETAVKEGKAFCDKHDTMDGCNMQEAKAKEAFPPGAKAPPFKSADGGDQDDSDDDSDDDDAQPAKGKGGKTITIQEGKSKESATVKEAEQFKHVYNTALAEARAAVSGDLKELQVKLAEAHARENLRESIDIAKTALKESTLPAAAATKLLPSLVGQAPEVIAQLIEAESNYLAAIGVSKTATAGNPGRVHVRESDTSNTSAIFAGMGN